MNDFFTVYLTNVQTKEIYIHSYQLPLDIIAFSDNGEDYYIEFDDNTIIRQDAIIVYCKSFEETRECMDIIADALMKGDGGITIVEGDSGTFAVPNKSSNFNNWLI